MLKEIWRGRLGGLRLVMMLATAALTLIGLANIYAATADVAHLRDYAQRQLMWIAIGLGGFVLRAAGTVDKGEVDGHDDRPAAGACGLVRAGWMPDDRGKGQLLGYATGAW